MRCGVCLQFGSMKFSVFLVQCGIVVDWCTVLTGYPVLQEVLHYSITVIRLDKQHFYVVLSAVSYYYNWGREALYVNYFLNFTNDPMNKKK